MPFDGNAGGEVFQPRVGRTTLCTIGDAIGEVCAERLRNDASTDLRASLALCSASLPATSLAVGRQGYSPRGRQTCLRAGNVSSEVTLGGEPAKKGGNYGSRSFALVDRYTPPDYPSHLGVRWASLMTAPIQFIVLKYKGKWSIKSRDLQ
jgi:hypothetical protein